MTKTQARVSAREVTSVEKQLRAEGYPPSETRLRTSPLSSTITTPISTTILPPPAPRSTYIYHVSNSPSALTIPHALVPTDNDFQSRARRFQSLWRERQELPIGGHRGRPLGSRLAMPSAQKQLTNYLTDTIRAVVRREVLDPKRSRGKLFSKPRIFNDLLSSQSLCFNLFAELQQDLPLASRVFSRLSLGRIDQVIAIGFQYSPGRGLVQYTADRSAFDVFVEYLTESGENGFAGVEVKYHESLDEKAVLHRDRYGEIARAMGCFDPAAIERLKQKPLQQIWRNHLLAGSLRLDQTSGYADGFFAFVYPEQNECCERAVNRYAACLTDRSTFARWTIEMVVAAIKTEGAGDWIDAFSDRYLGFDDLE